MGNEWPSGGEKTKGACPIVLAGVIVVFAVVRLIVIKIRQW